MWADLRAAVSITAAAPFWRRHKAPGEVMTKIVYRQPDGSEQVLDLPETLSVMQGALDSGVRGIGAECGGAAACSTCQVRVDDTWITRLPPPEDLEASMLDEEDLAANLRLSCQLRATPDLDGLVVHVRSTRN